MGATTCKNMISVLLSGSITIMNCAPPPQIGIAMARGSFQVNNSAVTGNTTLFDGNVIQTNQSSSSVRLANGVRLTLASNSKGAVYNDRLVLQSGETKVDLGSKYQVQSGLVRIVPTGNDSSAQIHIARSRVEVAVLRGSVNVTNAGGVLLARMVPGPALAYEQAGTADTHAEVTGTLRKQGSVYLLTDNTSRVTYQLIGAIPTDRVGQTVSVSGTIITGQAAAAGADQVLRVDSSRPPGAGAAAGAAAGGMAPATAHGLIIAGVLIAAAGIALGVTLANGEPLPASPTTTP